MDYTEFMKAYERFLVEDSAPPISDPQEKVEVIHETDWVQILLVREIPNEVEVKLVVELSLPAWIQPLSLTGNPNEAARNHTNQLRIILHELIRHLEYLLTLSKAGFRLGIIVEEGFWTAWIGLKHSPSKELFDVVSPPH